jgi:hypothetical protein
VNDADLIDRYVAEFAKRDNQLFRAFSLRGGVTATDVEPLLVEPWNERGVAAWRPKRSETPVAALDAFYRAVPGPLPPLYEALIRTYQWGEVDLETYRLLPNFPPSLEGLVKTLQSDVVMFRVLSSHRFVQFGKGPDVDYDPLCFDLNVRAADGECAVVQLDHEEVLSRERIRIVATFADSFRQLVVHTIEARDGRHV